MRGSLEKKEIQVFLFTVYRPPHMPSESFLYQFELAMLPYLKHNVWLVGDFNAQNRSWFADQTTDHHGDALKHFTDSVTCTS